MPQARHIPHYEQARGQLKSKCFTIRFSSRYGSIEEGTNNEDDKYEDALNVVDLDARDQDQDMINRETWGSEEFLWMRPSILSHGFSHFNE
ncbi:hypothetical protein BELL_1291g00010 [Botrytis elliptica]|uniref:Uncharacterized protein n=1 Tax=Botrytis elliptica TaxID=278938 RepID=A0A4Z1IP53_9HELO|nr:hypothetical protein BELL_1291g00010 [Botrytis elliptica]